MYDANEIKAWFHNARASESLVYHVGLLGRDVPSAGMGERREGLASQRAGKELLWSMACARRVHLVQRKLGAGEYQYIVVKASGDQKLRQIVLETSCV